MSIKFVSFSEAQHLYTRGVCVWFYDARGQLLDGIQAYTLGKWAKARNRRRSARTFAHHFKFCMENWGPGIQMGISQ